MTYHFFLKITPSFFFAISDDIVFCQDECYASGIQLNVNNSNNNRNSTMRTKNSAAFSQLNGLHQAKC